MKLLTFILARMIKKIAPFGAALALGLFLIAAPVAHACRRAAHCRSD